MDIATRHIRDIDRIERIHAPAEARIRLVLYTAALCRVIRKDYNIVATKMFLARGDKTLALSNALKELDRACVEAELACERHRRDYGIAFPPQTFEIRVISPFANRYRRCITRLDAINHLLVQAETRGFVRREQRMELVRPCLTLLHQVKRIALDLPEPKRREEKRESEAALA